ncbi:major facilitator superfamily MFS_1 [Leadbetterella byssophila DSM 17132]|uniref:Major facilitator superfamily MFS_1 n=1 Tax=Leadbetterella byssophila (strain DSM 17132 / JCM 16389 / KACC 11308 / NBRC 106382 / 4M15) TaxID=649349 RepID=E4RVF2_LEAB4|nr:MFS transporter [Leadbetterella byssophila]ADQ16138.1 major facilitator superfamily MFS_1 [Leadbetterella byssophila DSM 17132]
MKIEPQKRRWLIIAVIFLAIVFNYVDRQLVSILKPMLKGEFGLDDAGYALIVNVFTVCYAVMYPVTGWLVDRFGEKMVMFYGVIIWSLACIGGGLASTVKQFSFFRGLLGVAEPTNFPAQLKVVTVWFPGKLRATANSFCVAGSSIGAIIAPPLIAWLALTYNWKVAFIAMGAVGILIAILWKIVYVSPPASVSESEGIKDDGIKFSWPQLWKTRSLWGVILIRFVSDPVWYFCLFWLPGYLQESSGLTLAQIGMFGWIPFLVADLGAIGTSSWSDKMVRGGKEPLKARMIMLSTVAALGPLCAFTPFATSPWVTLLLFSLVAVACLSWLFSISVVIAEAFPVGNVASVLGIAGGFGAVGAVVFNYFVGQLMGSIGSEKIFLTMAVMHPLAVLLLWTMIRKEKPNVE